MASSNKASASDHPMHPMLLAAACRGSLKELKFLLNQEDDPQSRELRELLEAYSKMMHPAIADVEEGVDLPVPSAEELLAGVTGMGDTALHVVVANGDGEEFLECAAFIYSKVSSYLFKQNKNGDTPLHCAARAGNSEMVKKLIDLARNEHMVREMLRTDNHCKETALHEAVRVGDNQLVEVLLKEDDELARYPQKGSSPMYLAILLKRDSIAETLHYMSKDNFSSYVGSNGQNALHAAVLRGTDFPLLRFNRIRASISGLTNARGQTPLDIAKHKIPPGSFYNQNSEVRIHYALTVAGAQSGASRLDHCQRNYDDIHGLKSDQESKELEKIKDLSQARGIASVLIATVAFGATFALPGGYRADDHPNGGTPTLAGRYAFDAFVMANTLAFIFSSAATLCVVRAGSPTFNHQSRRIYQHAAFYLMDTSVTCLIAAFALGVYVVLGSVAHNTAVAVCAMTPVVVLSIKTELWLKWARLLPPFLYRMGLRWTLLRYTQLVIGNVFGSFLPFLIIFLWAAYGRSHGIPKIESPIAAPAPLA
ncbi:hypothetical protein ACP4OV_023848 [Aristida adscensionis]